MREDHNNNSLEHPYVILKSLETWRDPPSSICNPEKGLKKVLWNQKFLFITDFFWGNWGVYPSPLSKNFICLKILGSFQILHTETNQFGEGVKK